MTISFGEKRTEIQTVFTLFAKNGYFGRRYSLGEPVPIFLDMNQKITLG